MCFSTQKNPQPVALLFEDNGGDDEDDEDQGTLFNVNTNTALPTTKVSKVLCFCYVHGWMDG